MEEVISQWSSDFEHIKTETESIYTIARGKAVHAPMHLGGDPTNRESSSVTGLNIRSNFAARRTPSQPTTTPALGVASQNPRGRGMMIPSTNTISQSKKVRQQECDEPAPEDAPTTSSQRSPYPVQSPAVVARDFTQHKPSSSNGSTLGSSLSPNTGIAAGKKKAPPPPPKRIGSNTGMWVTALYSFKGQEGGDLSFEVGDRIKVVKKTESTDDWWEGELKGMRGKFPANYCEGA
jgi:amphiphysin